VPWAPRSSEPPEASPPFHAALETVTPVPDCVQVPFQPLVIFWSPPKLNFSDQLLSASPVLDTLRLRVNPPPQ
jgi:hypothetical protein